MNCEKYMSKRYIKEILCSFLMRALQYFLNEIKKELDHENITKTELKSRGTAKNQQELTF